LGKTPKDLGLPPKFKKYRQHQEGAIDDIRCEHKVPYLMQIAPTGIGKSLIYVAGCLQRGGRTVILTSTKGLQDQLMKDFGSMGLVEVRGRSNYRCPLTGTSASYGLCRWGFKCDMKEGGCPYYDAIRRANLASMVVTNYAFYLHTEALLPPANLVLDEAHSSFDHLISYYSAEINLPLLIQELGYDPGGDLFTHVGSAVAVSGLEKKLRLLVKKITKEGGQVSEIGPLSGLLENVRALRYALDLAYVKDIREGILRVTPVYADNGRLFREARFILLTSATVSAGTARLLGIPGGIIEIREYDSPFPVENRRVHVLPGVYVDRSMTVSDERKWARIIDDIIISRMEHKGIIHTVSYSRAERYRKYRELGDVIPLISPSSRSTASMVSVFKASDPPAVLISPSVTTGYDFPDDECRYQIISKVPFPDTEGELQRKRARLFPSYHLYYAWQQLVQAAGRGVRSETDWCDTFIIDSHFEWLLRDYRKMAPKWFLEAITKGAYHGRIV
jgi:Rad3-related DNA helicase